MTTKEYLGQAYKFYKFITLKKAELESYKELSVSVSSCGFEEKLNSSRNINAPFAKYTEKIIDLEKEISCDIEKLEDLKYEIGLKINEIQNINEHLILIYRHLMFMNWGEIAEKMSYSKRWVYKIYDRAVENFSGIIK